MIYKSNEYIHFINYLLDRQIESQQVPVTCQINEMNFLEVDFTDFVSSLISEFNICILLCTNILSHLMFGRKSD